MEFEYLLFDFDNTLVDFHDSSAKAFKKSFEKHSLKYSEEHYRTYQEINKVIWAKFERGEITTDDIRKERFAQLFEKLKISNIDPIAFNASYIEDIIFYTELYPGVMELLDKLKSKFRLSIVTNGLKEAQRARIHKVQLDDYFEHIIVSDEIGFAKPDHAYFEYTHTKIGFPKKEKVLVIGDNLKSDILGANNFGYHSCWISHMKKDGEIKPSFKITQVTELTKVLVLYENVACDFYDQLEMNAVLGRQVKLEIKGDSGITQVLKTRVKSLETLNKEEFLITSEGARIRLDKIVSVEEV